MTPHRERSLATKIGMVGAPFLATAFVAIAFTLWISWQLDGGAAAVNEAGRMRMQVYRLSLAAASGDEAAVAAHAAEFEGALALLRNGDADRPLFVPWDDTVRMGFATIERDWQQFRARPQRAAAAQFVARIDEWVVAIEHHLSRWTAILHLLQIGNILIALAGAAAFLYTGYLFVIGPVGQLKHATEEIQSGNLAARVTLTGNDEFATLGEGFNSMAGHLQSMYRNLEDKVAAKTAELEEKRARLEALYGVTAFVAGCTRLDALADGFLKRLVQIARADGATLEWLDPQREHFAVLASQGVDRQQADADSVYQTVLRLPVHHQQEVKGRISLYFHRHFELSESERSLFDTLATHLAAAMESIRLGAVEREAAVAQERSFIARELHDSIAQSLAFLKMQVPLLREAQRRGAPDLIAQTTDDIEAGVRESYGDVRELLMHFRTRANTEDIVPALQTTLRKFEHQTQVKTELSVQGQGIALPPDMQLQVLHVVQEALSNVRKHANASRVWLTVTRDPCWRFEVRDDGDGFEVRADDQDETRVGTRIMSERAERIGGRVSIKTIVGVGTSVVLTLPQPVPPPGAQAETAGAQQADPMHG